jgi:hypothetical protein
MATLKNMTRVGADVRQIARLLQAKAPENHMLAYITPEEAQLLKDRGGSGMPDPETGVPSFAPVSEYADIGQQFDYTPPPIQPDAQLFDPTFEGRVDSKKNMLPAIGEAPLLNAYRQGQREQQQADVSPDVSQYFQYQPIGQPGARAGSTYGVQAEGFNIVPEINIPPSPTYGVTGGKALSELTGAIPPGEKNIMARLAETTGLKEETLARLGLGGITALLNAPTIKKAREQSQRGRQDMEALAAPYLQKGAVLQRQAQAGELTPVARQQLQASQAQAAQAASARGGVGAQQTAARIEALRSQLLQQQYDYGLKLSGIGDQISLGAIKTGLQADQVVNQMTNNYMNNIVRTLMPQPKYVIAGQPNVTTE